MISSTQIKSRDFSLDPYTGEAQESFAFVKFILTTLEAKALSSTLHEIPTRQIDIPAALEFSKGKFDRILSQEANEHNKKICQMERSSQTI